MLILFKRDRDSPTPRTPKKSWATFNACKFIITINLHFLQRKYLHLICIGEIGEICIVLQVPCTKNVVIPCSRGNVLCITKILGKADKQRHLFSDCHQTLIDTKVCQNIILNVKFYKILYIRQPITFAIIFCHAHRLTLKQINRHFLKRVKPFLDIQKHATPWKSRNRNSL